MDCSPENLWATHTAQTAAASTTQKNELLVFRCVFISLVLKQPFPSLLVALESRGPAEVEGLFNR